jgi:tetrahydromethanopterin S-methyltransferase subunit B
MNDLDKIEIIKLTVFGMIVGLVIFALFGLAVAGFA